MEHYVTLAREWLVGYAPNVVGAIAILVLGWMGAKLVDGAIQRVLTRAELDPTLSGFLRRFVYMAVLAFVVVAAIQKLGVNATSFAAVVAAAGLAIGLSLQGSLSNFASGVLLIALRPFNTGDYVEAAGIAGFVEAVSVFATELRTPDNKKIIVPNSQITSACITNYSAKPTRRIDLVIGISYDDDIGKAKSILNDLLAADARVLKDPAPMVAVSQLGESSVDLVVRPWVASDDYWSVKFALTEQIKLQFDAKGISIPYPQRDLHVIQTESKTA